MHKKPVFVLTGFLGAGKSTLLNRLLSDPGFYGTAVVINEFGDIPIDHDLVHVGRTQLVRTTTGCLCCAGTSDLRTSLHELHVLAQSGEIAFDRVIIETTGLADPAPLVNELIPGVTPAPGLRDQIVAHAFALAGVVTLVDAVTGEFSIEDHFEAVKQIAFADRIVVTKADLAHDPATLRELRRLKARLARLNPAAPVVDASELDFDLPRLFLPRVYAPSSLGDDVTGWLALEEAIRGEGEHGSARSDEPEARFMRHSGRIRTFSITRENGVSHAAFARFLDLLVMSAGPRLLRVKGLVHDQDEPERPRVVHVVQHTVFPAAILEGWPDGDRRTRLVFITDGVDPEPVRRLFEAVLDGKPVKAGWTLRHLARFTHTFRSGAAQLARSLAG